MSIKVQTDIWLAVLYHKWPSGLILGRLSLDELHHDCNSQRNFLKFLAEVPNEYSFERWIVFASNPK